MHSNKLYIFLIFAFLFSTELIGMDQSSEYYNSKKRMESCHIDDSYQFTIREAISLFAGIMDINVIYDSQSDMVLFQDYEHPGFYTRNLSEVRYFLYAFEKGLDIIKKQGKTLHLITMMKKNYESEEEITKAKEFFSSERALLQLQLWKYDQCINDQEFNSYKKIKDKFAKIKKTRFVFYGKYLNHTPRLKLSRFTCNLLNSRKALITAIGQNNGPIINYIYEKMQIKGYIFRSLSDELKLMETYALTKRF